ncbi:mucin-associated surface protein (MASP), putative, partial [Trypanosoma cruzi]
RRIHREPNSKEVVHHLAVPNLNTSGSQGKIAAQGQPSAKQETSLATQPQVSGMRPPPQDEKQSGGEIENSPEPGEAPATSDTTLVTSSGTEGQIPQSSSPRSGSDNVTHQSEQHPEAPLGNTQQDDAAVADEERRRGETGGIPTDSHRGPEAAAATNANAKVAPPTEGSDGSTAVSHTTSPLLLLLVVACAAAAAVVAA